MNENEIRRKKREKNLFNMKSASNTFKYLLEKNINKNQENKIIYRDDKIEDFFLFLNKKYFIKDLNETDDDYILKEIKNELKSNKKHEAMYAKTANNEKKLEKYLIINPFQNKKNKYISPNQKNKKSKFIDLPWIFSKKKIKQNHESKKSLTILTFTDKNDETFFSEKKIKNKSNKKNNIETNKGYNMLWNTNSEKGFRTFHKRSPTFDKGLYLSTISDLNKIISKTKTNYRKYYINKEFGCRLVKNKFNFIYRNFFDN